MPSSNLSSWIPYLKEPLVLIGFVLMLFFGVIKLLVTKGTLHISKKSVERLVRQGLSYAFVLGVLIIIFGFVLTFRKSRENNHKEISNIQTTTGDQSPAIINKGQGSQVNLQYGAAPKEKNQTNPEVPHGTQTAVSSNKVSDTEQHTEGNQNPAIIANGNVTINYGVSQEAYNSLAETVKGNQKAIDHLLKNLDKKDIDIKKRDEEIQKWIQMYNELQVQFALRKHDDTLAAQAKEKLDTGDIEGAEKLLQQSLEQKKQNISEMKKVAASDSYELGLIKELQLDLSNCA